MCLQGGQNEAFTHPLLAGGRPSRCAHKLRERVKEGLAWSKRAVTVPTNVQHPGQGSRVAVALRFQLPTAGQQCRSACGMRAASQGTVAGIAAAT